MARQLVSPTQQMKGRPLFQAATSQRVLNAAWINVKPRVIHSKDATARAAAEVFANDPNRSIRELQGELRSGQFAFEPQRGVLKFAKVSLGVPKKAPRPIVIAPVRSRIVQRALLDICQSDDGRIKRRLGGLPALIATPTSVGGLPGRGVPQAISQISGAIAGGAKWFVRSDLKKFFQTIPKNRVEQFLRANITDPTFVDLFMRALATELENERDVRELLHLFPLGETGIPQGSALSALCANVVLAEFDAALNGRGLLTIRYLDDFVILGRHERAVMKGWERAQEILAGLGMTCHDPSEGTGKAAKGEIAEGFEFLSFHVDDSHVHPSSKVQKEFLADISGTIEDAKRNLSSVANPRRAEPRYVQSLNLIDRKIRGWGDAFSATTKRVMFAQLDAKIDGLISEYRSWFSRLYGGRDAASQRRLMGIALLSDTPKVSDR